MKKVITVFICLLLFASCEQDIITPEFEELNTEQTTFAKKDGKAQKVDVCHKGKMINVSINALSGHQGHGDAVDMDADGYFDLENDCTEMDCDDASADVNPGVAEEICDNGIDDNCNGEVDENCAEICPCFDDDTFALFNPTGYIDDRQPHISYTSIVNYSTSSGIEMNTQSGITRCQVTINSQLISMTEMDSPEPCRSMRLAKAAELGLPCFYCAGN